MSSSETTPMRMARWQVLLGGKRIPVLLKVSRMPMVRQRGRLQMLPALVPSHTTVHPRQMFVLHDGGGSGRSDTGTVTSILIDTVVTILGLRRFFTGSKKHISRTTRTAAAHDATTTTRLLTARPLRIEKRLRTERRSRNARRHPGPYRI